VNKIDRALDAAGKSTNGSKVLICGVSYKAGVADLREAPALKIIRRLRELGAEVAYSDPLIAELPELGLSSEPLESAAREADVVAIGTAHPGIDHAALVRDAELVVDFRGVTRGIEAPNLVRL
jgi:UDP-N-acetyl-D-glucosamine dehydrogenase